LCIFLLFYILYFKQLKNTCRIHQMNEMSIYKSARPIPLILVVRRKHSMKSTLYVPTWKLVLKFINLQVVPRHFVYLVRSQSGQAIIFHLSTDTLRLSKATRPHVKSANHVCCKS
jgi:hypothetical protein